MSPKPNNEGKKMSVKNDQTARKEALLNRLQDGGYEYVDMTESGGSLYFFDVALSEELKKAGYKVSYASKGTKKTGNRPAWYISFK